MLLAMPLSSLRIVLKACRFRLEPDASQRTLLEVPAVSMPDLKAMNIGDAAYARSM